MLTARYKVWIISQVSIRRVYHLIFRDADNEGQCTIGTLSTQVKLVVAFEWS